MSANTFGMLFRVTTFGESHGVAMGCVIDGCPPGMELSAADIQPALDRRRPGSSRYVTQRKETDQVEILSGVFEGRTTGTPIALMIRNNDARSKDYRTIASSFRPGHADFTYQMKYGHRDYRGGGRASARETACRVAAGAVAQKWLQQQFGVKICGYVEQIGEVIIDFESLDYIDENPFFIANRSQVGVLEDYLQQIRRELDSVGAKVKIIATGVPAGWGDPVFDRLDARLAQALMSINAVKAVEIGAGMAVAGWRGSQNNDAMSKTGFLSNHAGGILGGISTGSALQMAMAIKPTPSIAKPLPSIDTAGNATEVATHGRHDPCVGIRAVPVAEAMVALVFMDHALRQRAQCGDVVNTAALHAAAKDAD